MILGYSNEVRENLSSNKPRLPIKILLKYDEWEPHVVTEQFALSQTQ